MADMEIKVNRNPIQVNDIKIPAQTQGVEKTDVKRPEAEAEPRQRVEDTLENVVSVSEDGDTVQVTEESTERLEEDAFGKMAVKGENENVAADEDTTEVDAGQIRTENVDTTKDDTTGKKAAEKNPAEKTPTRERLEKAADPTKPDPAKERLKAMKESEQRRKEIIKDMVKTKDDDVRADQRAEAKEEQQAKQNITSLTGYTGQQLQQMVRKGEISQNDYDKEMKARSERTEAAIDRNNEFTKDLAADIAKEELTTRQGEELRMVYDEDSADVPDAATRADILDKLQDFTLNN